MSACKEISGLLMLILTKHSHRLNNISILQCVEDLLKKTHKTAKLYMGLHEVMKKFEVPYDLTTVDIDSLTKQTQEYFIFVYVPCGSTYLGLRGLCVLNKYDRKGNNRSPFCRLEFR